MAQVAPARGSAGKPSAARAPSPTASPPPPVVDARGGPPAGRPPLLRALLPTLPTMPAAPAPAPPADLHPAQAAQARVVQAEALVRAVLQARGGSARAALRLALAAEPVVQDAVRLVARVVREAPRADRDRDALALLRTFLAQAGADPPDPHFGPATLAEVRGALERLLEGLGLPAVAERAGRGGDLAWTREPGGDPGGGGRLGLVVGLGLGLPAVVFLIFAVLLAR